MIKRALAATLCLMLVFALLPKTARAASPASVYIWGMELNSSNPYYKNGDSGAKGSYGTASDWNAHYDPVTGELTLRNLNVVYQPDAGNNSGIYAAGSSTTDLLTIALQGDNCVSTKNYDSGNNFAINIDNCSLTIQDQGSGTLTATAGNAGNSYSDSFGVYAGGSITVTGCSLTGTGGASTRTTTGHGSFGVCAESDITAGTGGTITGTGVQSTADSYGVYSSNGQISALGGTIKGTGGSADLRSCGVYAGNAITADGGTITGTGGAAGPQSYGVYLPGTGTGVEIKNNGTIKGTGGAANDDSTGVVTGQMPTKLTSGRLVSESVAGGRALAQTVSDLPDVYYWRTGKSDGYTEKNGTQGQAYQYNSTHTFVDIRTGLPTAITFSTQPVSTSVTQGNITSSLTAAANASPGDEVTLNWFSCDASGTPTGSSLATGGTFAIPTTLTAGTYHYLCQATCPGATSVNSGVATVTVTAPMHVLIWGEELAAGKPYYINGANGTKGTTHATAVDWNAYYDAPNGTLRLNGLNVVKSIGRANDSNTQSPKDVLHGIYAGSDIIIALEGENTVSTGDASMISIGYSIPGSFNAVHVDGNLVLRGSGSLTATAGSRDGTNFGASHGVCVEGVLTVEDCTLTAAGGDDSVDSRGVYADVFTVKDNAQVTATGGNTSDNSYGVWPISGLKLDGAVLTAIGGASSDASYGLCASGVDIEIIGGRLEAQTLESTSTDKGAFAVQIDPSKFTLPSVYYWRTASSAAYTGYPATAFDITSPLTPAYTYIDILDRLPISFTTQPAANTSVTAGSITGNLSAAASVSPSGTATLNWYACSADGTPTGSSLGTGGTFAIPTTLTAGTYYYLCQASCPSAALKSNVATVTVQAQTYTIAVSPSTMDFGSKIAGYTTAPTARTLTITNNGNWSVDVDTTALSGGNYSFTDFSATRIAAGGTATCKVAPKPGLAAGTYNAPITVSTTQGSSATLTPSFTVIAATYSIAVTPEAYDFGTKSKNYWFRPAAQRFTVRNTGNSPVTLSALNSSTAFEIDTPNNWETALAPNGARSFKVQPNLGLNTGTYDETFTVFPVLGTGDTFGAKFVVGTEMNVTISGDPGLSIVAGQSTALTANITGGTAGATYTYAWTIPATSTTPFADTKTVTVSPTASTTYQVLVTEVDNSRNTAIATVTVTAATHGITINPATIDFGTLAEGYVQPAAQTVTVTYTGNIGSVTLTQPTSTQYDIGSLSATTLDTTNTTATFTVQPKAGLSKGVYTAPITVATDKDSNAAAVTPSFTVVSIYDLLISPGAAFMQGNAPETTVTIGAGITGFGLGNFVSAEMGLQNGVLTPLTEGTDYDKAEGSIIITLHQAYLNTLMPGVYTLRINLTGAGYPAYVETTIIVNAPGGGGDVGADVPETGDSATPVLWLGLMLLAGAGLAVSAVRRKRV